MILHGFVAIMYWFALLPAAFLLGSFFQKWIREEDEILRGVFFVTFGLSILSYFIAFLGSFRLLTLWPIVGLLTLAFSLRFRYLPEFKRWIVSIFRFLRWPAEGVFCKITLGVFLTTVVGTIFLTFLPEIAHDSLCYHLNLPKLFIRNASIMPIEHDLKSYHSQFMEILYTIGLFLNNVSVSKLFHWFAGFFTVILLMVIIDKQTKCRGLSIFFGLMLWLTPTFLNQLTITYSDIGVTIFVFSSFLFLVKGLYDSQSLRDIFLAGLLLGFAVSCKYSAVLFAAPILGWLMLLIVREAKARRSFLVRSLCLFSAGIFAGCGYWFLRSFIATGDPFFPYLTSRFGGTGLYAEIDYANIGIPKSFMSLMTLPFSIVFSPDFFERHAWAGPFYLLSLPLVAWGAIRDSKARFSAFVSISSVVLWFFLAQNIRFLLPIFPLLLYSASIGLAKLPSWCQRTWLKRFGIGVGVGCTFLLVCAGLYHYRVHFLALGQGWNSETFLTRLERTYSAAQWTNRNLPRDARIFSEDVRQYYFDREMIADNNTFYHPDEDLSKLTPEDFLAHLKHLGVTHVLQISPVEAVTKDWNPKRRNLKDMLDSASSVSFLAEIPSQNIRERRFNYRIYKLN